MAHSFDGMHRRLISRFGEQATYSPISGDPEAVSGVWNYSEEAKAREKGIAGVFTAPATAFVVTPSRNAAMVIRGETYIIRNDPDDDGSGMVELLLRKR